MSVQRFASVIRLRPEKEAEYRALHADVWPGVLAALTRAHVRNYSIFLRDGVLFGYLEYVGDDYEADMARVAEDPETRRWWLLTDPCQQSVEGAAATAATAVTAATAAAGEKRWWAPMEEVFHLE